MSLLDRFLGRAPEPVPLTLYSKPGCHLCDVLKGELARLDLGRPVALEVVDISGDAKLAELYGKRIPVLAAAGKPIAEGRVDVRALRRAFEARADEWDRARLGEPFEARLMARLYVLSGADIGRTLDFEQPIRIGRIAGCDLVLRDASISRSHARVERGPDGWEVIDEDSRNGVTFAGARVPRAVLADGQEFKLGEVLLRFREATAAPAVAPPAATPLVATAVRAPAPRAAPAPAPVAESGLELEQADEIDLGAAPARKAAPAVGEGLREQRGRVLQYHRAAESDSPLSFEFAQLPLWQRALVVTLAAALMAALAWGAFLGSAFLKGKLAQPEVEETE